MLSYFIKRTWTRTRIFRKSVFYTKIHWISQKLTLGKFEVAHFKMRQYYFKFSTQKYLNKSFLLSNIAFYILSPKFAIRQIRALILNITFSIFAYFHFSGQNYQNQVFLVPNLVIFIFASIFARRQIWGPWFQIWQYVLKIAAKNTQMRHFWS